MTGSFNGRLGLHSRLALSILMLFITALLPFSAFAHLSATNDPTDYSTVELGGTDSRTVQVLNYAPKIPNFDTGEGYVACAISADNTVKCWGDNGAAGKLSADGKEARPQKTPYPAITSTGDAVNAGAGIDGVCAWLRCHQCGCDEVLGLCQCAGRRGKHL